MKNKKINYQKAMKLLSKGENQIFFNNSETAGNMLVCDGHCIITVPEFEFNFFKESNSDKIRFNEMEKLNEWMKYDPDMFDVKMTSLEVNFDGNKKATIFRSADGKFLSCVNSKFIEIVRETFYGDCLNFGKAKNQKSPIVYSDGAGCGFIILPINMNAVEILNDVLDFES